MPSTLLKTPLHSHHLALGARMVPFAGFEMPVQYQGVLEETRTCRSSGGLFDVSHMGQIRLKGKGILEKFQLLVTNQLQRLQINQVQYNLLCNEAGGVIDDILVYFQSPQELFLCVNASNRHAVFDWISQRLPSDVSVEDESDSLALIAVQGPQAELLLSQLGASCDLQKLFYYWSTPATLSGISILLSRTGYTGEDGFELYVSREQAPELWELLELRGKPLGVLPCGLGARDTLRLEMGYPLHGHEISLDFSPIQAGLQWAVKTELVPSFIGKSALQAQLTGGASPVLKAFIVEDKRIARQGYEIATPDQKIVGTISSGSFSPHLGKPIALGFIQKETAPLNHFLVKIRNDWVPMSKSTLPFVPSRVRKAPK